MTETISSRVASGSNKCPRCGGELKAFATRCELCGHELSGVDANRTVSSLVQRFNDVENELLRAGLTGAKLERELTARRARVIRDFPIPNAREDLQSLIYFIHPKLVDSARPDPNAEDWRVKFKEVLNMAKSAYKSDAKVRAEFEEIERSLNVSLSGALQSKARQFPVLTLGIVLVAVIVVIAIGASQFSRWKAGQCASDYAKGAAAENTRLEKIAAQVMNQQKNGDFNGAVTTLSTLHWNFSASCEQEAAATASQGWEQKRQELLGVVTKAQNDAQGAQQQQAKQAEDAKRAAAVKEQAQKIGKQTTQKINTLKGGAAW